MAVLHVKSPNGTEHTIDLTTMNVRGTPGAGWTQFQNGLIIQWGYNYTSTDIYHPIVMANKLFCTAIHIGTNSSVNIVALDVRAYSPDISYFISDFPSNPTILVFWMCIGA